MATVTFITYDGEKHEAALVEGQSLMQVATDNAVPGIDGDCGGESACGTCHVIVDGQWADLTGRCGDDEELMLAMHPERRSASRLSCQIALSADLDGLTVQLPEFQL